MRYKPPENTIDEDEEGYYEGRPRTISDQTAFMKWSTEIEPVFMKRNRNRVLDLNKLLPLSRRNDKPPENTIDEDEEGYYEGRPRTISDQTAFMKWSTEIEPVFMKRNRNRVLDLNKLLPLSRRNDNCVTNNQKTQ